MGGHLGIQQEMADGVLNIAFDGKIDDDSDYSPLIFDGVQKAVFNFEGVKLINSSGIQKWIKFFEAIPDSVVLEFIRCPLRIITQINLVPGFLCNRSVDISTFFAPYYCEECDESTNIMLETKSAFPDLNDINAPEMRCESCNSEMEFDGIEKKYFIFLKRKAA